MRLTSINIQNFLGISDVDLSLTKPVTLFAGLNGAGKSSIQEAVRMALTGESVRVGLKKNFGQLVIEGEKNGFVEVMIDGVVRAFLTLPDGKTAALSDYVMPAALPFVLDAQSFARLNENDRRAFLFGLMGLSAGGADVKKRLLAKGCNADKVETIMPMLRAGFDVASEDAKNKARDEKTAWRTITGETYGDKKAATWSAEKSEFDDGYIVILQDKLDELNAKLSKTNQNLGAMQAEQKQHAETTHKLAELREKAAKYARIAEKLKTDESELNKWERLVENTRKAAGGVKKIGLLHDLALATDSLVERLQADAYSTLRAGSEYAAVNSAMLRYFAEHGEDFENQGDDEAKNNLPEFEKTLVLMQNSVANGKRDLAAADAAAKAILALNSAMGKEPDETKIAESKQMIAEITSEQKILSKSLEVARETERKNKQAIDQTAKAQKAHQSVMAWLQIADALAPDGIPGEMLSEALNPINDRLLKSATEAEWPQVELQKDMQITGGGRDYNLLSESEKWRVDAMIAEAIAFISGIKVLVLDRFDVLDLKGRDDLIAWLDILAQDNEINTALIFGTLKKQPENLPQTISVQWVENGTVWQ